MRIIVVAVVAVDDKIVWIQLNWMLGNIQIYIEIYVYVYVYVFIYSYNKKNWDWLTHYFIAQILFCYCY